jgi:hypothetical protein
MIISILSIISIIISIVISILSIISITISIVISIVISIISIMDVGTRSATSGAVVLAPGSALSLAARNEPRRHCALSWRAPARAAWSPRES